MSSHLGPPDSFRPRLTSQSADATSRLGEGSQDPDGDEPV